MGLGGADVAFRGVDAGDLRSPGGSWARRAARRRSRCPAACRPSNGPARLASRPEAVERLVPDEVARRTGLNLCRGANLPRGSHHSAAMREKRLDVRGVDAGSGRSGHGPGFRSDRASTQAHRAPQASFDSTTNHTNHTNMALLPLEQDEPRSCGSCGSWTAFAAMARRGLEGFASISGKLRRKRKILGVAALPWRRYEARPFAAQQ